VEGKREVNDIRRIDRKKLEREINQGYERNREWE